MSRLLSSLLVISYIFALIMSAGHLAEWYRLTLGSLPPWFATGLATALEASAFLLSLLSNSLLKASRWAAWGAVVALALVWVGNYMSMLRAGVGVPAYEVFLSSLFVPVSTFVVAKVLGELLGKDSPRVEEGAREEPPPVTRMVPPPETPKVSSRFPLEPLEVSPPETTEVSTLVTTKVSTPETTRGEPPRVETWGNQGKPLEGRNGYTRYLDYLETPRTVRELVQELGVSKTAVYKALRALEAKGLVENRGGTWVTTGQGGQQNPASSG